MFVEDGDLDSAQPAFETAIQATDAGTRLTVVAHSFLRDLVLLVDEARAGAAQSSAMTTAGSSLASGTGTGSGNGGGVPPNAGQRL